MIPLFIGAALIGAGIADDISTFKREAREAQAEAEQINDRVNRQVDAARSATNNELIQYAKTKAYAAEYCYKDFLDYFQRIRNNIDASELYIDATDLIEMKNAVAEIDRLVIQSGGIENIATGSLLVLGSYGIAEVGAAIGIEAAASAVGVLGGLSTFAAPLALIVRV